MSLIAGETSETKRFWNKYEEISATGTAGAAKFATSSASTTQAAIPTAVPVRCSATGIPVMTAASTIVAIGPGAQPGLSAISAGARGRGFTLPVIGLVGISIGR